MSILQDKYELMMEEVYSKCPLSNENARLIVHKYDREYRNSINNKDDESKFELLINMNHPSLHYKY